MELSSKCNSFDSAGPFSRKFYIPCDNFSSLVASEKWCVISSDFRYKDAQFYCAECSG